MKKMLNNEQFGFEIWDASGNLIALVFTENDITESVMTDLMKVLNGTDNSQSWFKIIDAS